MQHGFAIGGPHPVPVQPGWGTSAGRTGLPAWLRGSVVVVGNFDGVHLGHRHLIHQAAAIAADLGALVGTLTFEPHPRAVFSNARNFRLASASSKRELLVAAGADFVAVEPFTPALGHSRPRNSCANTSFAACTSRTSWWERITASGIIVLAM